jgi:hypothetical protein
MKKKIVTFFRIPPLRKQTKNHHGKRKIEKEDHIVKSQWMAPSRGASGYHRPCISVCSLLNVTNTITLGTLCALKYGDLFMATPTQEASAWFGKMEKYHVSQNVTGDQ